MNVFRTLSARGFRVVLICVLVVGVFGFGHFMTPRPPTAAAEVYMDLGRALEGVPAYMKTRVKDGDVNEVYLNGNTLYYTQYRSSKPIDTLLDYYENMYKGDVREVADQATKDRLLKTVKNAKDRAEHARRIEETEKLINQRYVRLDGEKWGAFATIVTGKEGEAEWSADMKTRFENFDKTGEVSALGDAKIVVAFADDANGGTQYMNVWPDENFNRKNMRPKRRQDGVGYDIEDIPRPRGSFRLITFGQELGDADYSIHIYRGASSIDQAENHFLQAMELEGWGLSQNFMAGREKMEEQMDSPNTFLFLKDGREAYISLEESAENSVTSTVVVYHRT
ncbi:MAG: hypothetical protein KDA24_01955 [Deltaproteobacteria bacterium]|nr:hypothetical protein [Deltaproteobacteria bacterium]